MMSENAVRIPTGTILTVSVLSALSAVPLLAGCGADDGRATRTAQSAVPAAVPDPDPPPRTASPSPDVSPTGDGPRSPAPTCTPGTASPAPDPNASADIAVADAATAPRPGPADCVRDTRPAPSATRSVPPPASKPDGSPRTTEEAGPETVPEAPDLSDGGGRVPEDTAVTDAIFDSPTGVLGG
ncbi:hypothetical protein [Streptomyces sp. NPDC001508]|uniref:hypothetical protein n=1 Tax=Streptomyces sp. NPDC001508 TaxID=3154656 RepID=UPI0033286246